MLGRPRRRLAGPQTYWKRASRSRCSRRPVSVRLSRWRLAICGRQREEVRLGAQDLDRNIGSRANWMRGKKRCRKRSDDGHRGQPGGQPMDGPDGKITLEGRVHWAAGQCHCAFPPTPEKVPRLRWARPDYCARRSDQRYDCPVYGLVPRSRLAARWRSLSKSRCRLSISSSVQFSRSIRRSRAPLLVWINSSSLR